MLNIHGVLRHYVYFMIKKLLLIATIISALSADADLVAHFSMDVRNGQIEESISGDKFDVLGNFAPENVEGAVGRALRFDGYTSHINARLGNIFSDDTRKMTVSLWVALPCYPIIQIDTDTSEKTPVITCLNEDEKTGFGFYLGFNGKYSFRTYVGGWPVNIDVDTPLPVYQWNNLVSVVDCDAKTVKLYNNGEEVGSGKANGSISYKSSEFYMGQGNISRKSGPFELMSFNGLIDDISIWNEAIELETIKSWKAETDPDLNIPSSRFADDMLRPRFHGMPASGWTNECHGMYYADGRYHLFFQKNADGPYMARLHWGHISSENLYDWKEENIALAPGEWYNIKGCWSGCVFNDEILTGGKPNIMYTAVDYAKAMIACATPDDESLVRWTENDRNPIIGGRPAGLSDDFRDPYFFRKGEDAYLIVGTSKNGIGATTLHKYNPIGETWSNDGAIFFTGSSALQDGTFWEMPNITPMVDGRWLFTATPLETAQGVRTLYWVGNIGDDGKFIPDSNSSVPRLVEMNSKEGFGMLSPTIYQHEGKTIALGIVPDKLSANTNWKLGWAHCYSLPREWNLSEDGSLLQKPFEGLKDLRTSEMYSNHDFELKDVVDLSPVRGRSVEVYGIFEVGISGFGFNIFKSGNSYGVISYDPASAELIVDFSNIQRLSNDTGVYDGIYRCPIPDRPAPGSDLKINFFIDHSILDIFVNDKYATSIRVFPTETCDDVIEAFSAEGIKVKELKAWILDVDLSGSGINDVVHENNKDKHKLVDVYDLQGTKVRSKVSRETAVSDLPKGIYIVDHEKVVVR